MHALKPKSSPQTLVQRLSPRVRLAGAVVLVVVTALMPRRPDSVYWIPAGLLAILWILSRMPVRYALRRLVLVECFILGIALLSLFRPAAVPVFLSALIKSNLCVLAMLILTWTTPFHEILQELRRLRLPPVMLTTLALMYRYLPVLGDETRRMQRARASRTFSKGRRRAWQSLGTIVGRLFLRSTDRAERIYLAMCARGWK